jgi:hypothetical protein
MACAGCKDADEIAMFLVKMACVGSASLPFSTAQIELKSQGSNILKCSTINNSFASMMTVLNGSAFWRQRVVYKTIPIVVNAAQIEAQSQNPPALSFLAVVATLCCLDSTLTSEANFQAMVPTLVAGLVHLSKDLEALTCQDELSSNLSDVLGMILAAIIKLYELSPQCVSNFEWMILSRCDYY